MKKLVCLFLAAVLMVTAFALPAGAAAPKLSIKPSYVSGCTYVSISGKGDIYYTTDGSKPTKKSQKYTGRFKLTNPAKVRAALYVNGKRMTAVYKTVSVKLATPSVELIEKDPTYAVYEVKGDNNAALYMTTDGSTPSENNGERIYGDTVYVYDNCTLKIISIRNGWKNSSVKTVEVSGILTPDMYADEVIRLVNIEREKYGVAPLERDDTLMQAAQLRAEELSESFSHTRPDGSSCFTVLKDMGISYWAGGENIAAGQRTPQKVVDSWMNSPGHRANILSEGFTAIGVGYYNCDGGDGGYGRYWTQMFIG